MELEIYIGKQCKIDNNLRITQDFGYYPIIQYKDKEYKMPSSWVKRKRRMDVTFQFDEESSIIGCGIELEKPKTVKKLSKQKDSTVALRNTEEYRFYRKCNFTIRDNGKPLYLPTNNWSEELFHSIFEMISKRFLLEDFDIKWRLENYRSFTDFEEMVDCLLKLKNDELVEKDNLVRINGFHNINYFFCPLCGEWFAGSDYLFETFKGDHKAIWLSNMVTHYRHGHITSWNKCWGYGGYSYRYGWFGDYDEEKAKVNERAKRQIIRKATDFLIENGFTSEDFKKLKNTTQETIDLAVKKLDGKKC